MQYKRNLSNSKAFTQLRNFKFTETHIRDKEVQEGWLRPNYPSPGVEKQKDPVVREKGWREKGKGQGSRSDLGPNTSIASLVDRGSAPWSGLSHFLSFLGTELLCCPHRPSRSRYFRVMGDTWPHPKRNSKGIIHVACIMAGAILWYLLCMSEQPLR